MDTVNIISVLMSYRNIWRFMNLYGEYKIVCRIYNAM